MVIISLVLPSRIISLGATRYPRPAEVIPIDLNDANESISTTCGNKQLGWRVVSDGNPKPISSISVLRILPTLKLSASATAPLPRTEVMVEIPGKE